MKKNLFVGMAVILFLALCSSGPAAIVIEVQEDFEGGIGAWSLRDDADPPPGGLPSAGSSSSVGAGNPGQGFQVDVDTGGNFTPFGERIYAPTGTGFAGNENYNVMVGDPAVARDQYVWFDFWSDVQGSATTAPSGVGLFFYSSTGGATWYYGVSGPIDSQTWYTFQVPMFDDGSGSWSLLNGGGTLSTALQDVDQIGVRILYLTDTDNQQYVLDNFRRGFMVPEPGTYAALGFALTSLGMTFRRRLNGVMGTLKGMLKG